MRPCARRGAGMRTGSSAQGARAMADVAAIRAKLDAVERQIRLLIGEGNRLRDALPEYRFPKAPGYRGTHWGKGGEFKIAKGVAGDPRGGLTLLGELTEVAYRTDKGGYPRAAGFRHVFEDPPALTYTRPEGRLVLVGGDYRLTMRGIEG